MAERTIFIENRCKIGYSNDYLKIDREGEVITFHINEFDVIIFSSLEISCSLYLLNKLSEKGKSVIFCNSKKLPYCNLSPLTGTQNAYLRLQEQLSWSKEAKDIIWKKIVEIKIQSQLDAMKFCGTDNSSLMPYVEPGDPGNAEGRFANYYFNNMFGKQFLRHNNDNINAALNYGYAVLLSVTARIVASHGYNQMIGIHHSSATNNFNLSCDIMEPFRPIVDIIVKYHGDKPLDTSYKCELAHSIYENIKYKGKNYSIKYAIDLFFTDIIQSMRHNENTIGEFRIAT